MLLVYPGVKLEGIGGRGRLGGVSSTFFILSFFQGVVHCIYFDSVIFLLALNLTAAQDVQARAGDMFRLRMGCCPRSLSSASFFYAFYTGLPVLFADVLFSGRCGVAGSDSGSL